ncbi:hypothetical protein DXG01_016095 [Tephrocybe rancida]|nr:hypothetical protein DXG01_016095 [Tephrocybe rancida]
MWLHQTFFTVALLAAFGGLQGIHENLYSTNITQYNPLLVDQFIIALRPANLKERRPAKLLLGEVIAMYTKAGYRGEKHEAVKELQSVGHASYVYIQLYAPFGSPAYFQSLACESLSSSTFLQMPRAQIIFLLAQYTITKHELRSTDAHPFNVATLGPEAVQIHSGLATALSNVTAAVQLLNCLTLTRKSSRPAAVQLLQGPHRIDKDPVITDNSENSESGMD